MHFRHFDHIGEAITASLPPKIARIAFKGNDPVGPAFEDDDAPLPPWMTSFEMPLPVGYHVSESVYEQIERELRPHAPQSRPAGDDPIFSLTFANMAHDFEEAQQESQAIAQWVVELLNLPGDMTAQPIVQPFLSMEEHRMAIQAEDSIPPDSKFQSN